MTVRNGNVKNSDNSSHDRLVGWLVSYALDQMGKAFEIRSGRTFIGNQPLTERTIALDAQDISLAHAALNASPRHKVVLQDVFSDSGTYVCQSSAEPASAGQSGVAQEQRIEGPVEVKHGDWLRFGNKTRFQGRA